MRHELLASYYLHVRGDVSRRTLTEPVLGAARDASGSK